MAQRIVHLFESVDVNHQDGQRTPEPVGPGGLGPQSVKEPPPVQNSSQLICPCELFKLRLQPLAGDHFALKRRVCLGQVGNSSPIAQKEEGEGDSDDVKEDEEEVQGICRRPRKDRIEGRTPEQVDNPQ